MSNKLKKNKKQIVKSEKEIFFEKHPVFKKMYDFAEKQNTNEDSSVKNINNIVCTILIFIVMIYFAKDDYRLVVSTAGILLSIFYSIRPFLDIRKNKKKILNIINLVINCVFAILFIVNIFL